MAPESFYLSGRVLKRSLPVIQGPSEPNAEIIKRLFLPQGELAQFYDADEPIRYVAYIEFRESGMRGNHYHNIKDEWIYLLSGEVDLLIEDVKTKERASLSMQTGDRVFIPAGVAHAFRTVKSGGAVELSPVRFNATDIHRYPLS